MSNLIINGIDHSKFDLEWAKRGGVVVQKGKPFLYKLIGSEKFGKTTIYYLVRIYFPSPEFISIPEKDCRMAMSSECEFAGIEYIEPPMMWLPINTLTTDIPVPLIVCDKKSKQRGVLTGENIFGGACISGWNDDNITPTHWMPLPQPPKDK